MTVVEQAAVFVVVLEYNSVDYSTAAFQSRAAAVVNLHQAIAIEEDKAKRSTAETIDAVVSYQAL